MKNILKYLTLITLSTIIFSCDVDMTPTNSASDDSYLSDLTASQARVNNISGDNFNITGIAAVADAETLNDVTYDVITISFENGQVDDTTTNLANIIVYPLSDAANATTPYTRDTAVTFDLTTVTTSGDDSTVKLKIANTSTTFDIATAFEVVINPDITAYDGAIYLNQDGDDIEAEANDDVYVETVVSTGLTTGKKRNLPSDTVISAFSMAYTIDTTTGDITYTISSTGTTPLALNTFSADSIDGDVVVEQYDYTTHTWSTITVTTSYSSSTGELLIDLPAVAEGDAYRWELTESAISQDSTLIADSDYLVKYEVVNTDLKTLDATLSGNYVADLGTGGYFNTTTPTITTTANNSSGNKYIDVTFGSLSGDILTDTLTADNIKFSILTVDTDNDNDNDDSTVYIDFDSVEEITDNVFRFYVTTGFSLLTVSGSATADIPSTTLTTTVYPSVMEDAGTSTSTADDLHIGDSSEYLGALTYDLHS